MSDTRVSDDIDEKAEACAECAALAAEVERLRRALTEIRRWTVEATHPKG